jgi:hypothetical protein
VVLDGNERWEVLFAPLPGRIFLRAEDIAAPVREQLGLMWERAAWSDGPMSRRLRFREYAVESPEYKERLFERDLPGDAADAHSQVACARWLWVTEVQDADLAVEGDSRCVLGEIVVDATSDARDLGFLFANVPGLCAWWEPDRSEPQLVLQPREGFHPYTTGTALNV